MLKIAFQRKWTPPMIVLYAIYLAGLAFSYPLEIFFSRSSKKLLFVKLVREFVRLIKNWRMFKSVSCTAILNAQ